MIQGIRLKDCLEFKGSLRRSLPRFFHPLGAFLFRFHVTLDLAVFFTLKKTDTARVYNWDVKQRRATKAKAG